MAGGVKVCRTNWIEHWNFGPWIIYLLYTTQNTVCAAESARTRLLLFNKIAALPCYGVLRSRPPSNCERRTKKLAPELTGQSQNKIRIDFFYALRILLLIGESPVDRCPMPCCLPMLKLDLIACVMRVHPTKNELPLDMRHTPATAFRKMTIPVIEHDFWWCVTIYRRGVGYNSINIVCMGGEMEARAKKLRTKRVKWERESERSCILGTWTWSLFDGRKHLRGNGLATVHRICAYRDQLQLPYAWLMAGWRRFCATNCWLLICKPETFGILFCFVRWGNWL